MDKNIDFDVVVVGAGNAALCAALSASEVGASVLVLEKSPKHAQGGNCPYTGAGFRFTHDGIDDLKSLLPHNTDIGDFQMSPGFSRPFFRSHIWRYRSRTNERCYIKIAINY